MSKLAEDQDVLVENDVIATTTPSSEHSEDSPLHLRESANEGRHDAGHGFLYLTGSTVLVAVAITIALIISAIYGKPQVSPHGAVSSPDERCSKMGLAQLKAGGSAADAAVTCALCLGLVRPHASGIGGGAQILLLDHAADVSSFYDFREQAPQAATPNFLNSQQMGLWVGVPAELKALEALHKAKGKLKWEEVLQPVIDLAERGFKLHADTVSALRAAGTSLSSDLAQLYLAADNSVQPDRMVQRTDLAATLRRVQSEGVSVLYSGETAQAIVRTINETGGVLTSADLEAYEGGKEEALGADVFGFRVLTGGAPSAGPWVTLTLMLMSKLNATKDSFDKPEFWGQFLQVSQLAEQSFHKLDSGTNSSHDLISPSTVISLLGHVSSTPWRSLAPDALRVRKAEAAHVSVVDNDELFVALSSSLGAAFGSQLLVNGVLLNDQMRAFSQPGDPGSSAVLQPGPGKRPLSHLTPLVVYDRNRKCGLRFATGSSGDLYAPVGMAQVLLHALLHREPVTKAVHTGRLWFDETSSAVLYEDSFAAKKLLRNSSSLTLLQTEAAMPASLYTGFKLKAKLNADADVRGNGRDGAVVY